MGVLKLLSYTVTPTSQLMGSSARWTGKYTGNTGTYTGIGVGASKRFVLNTLSLGELRFAGNRLDRNDSKFLDKDKRVPIWSLGKGIGAALG